jgi:hypothetical protein
VLLFGLRGEQTIRQPTVIALLAVPIVLPDTSDPQMVSAALIPEARPWWAAAEREAAHPLTSRISSAWRGIAA